MIALYVPFCRIVLYASESNIIREVGIDLGIWPELLDFQSCWAKPARRYPVIGERIAHQDLLSG